jgi:hypothetical protein
MLRKKDLISLFHDKEDHSVETEKLGEETQKQPDIVLVKQLESVQLP